VALFLLLGTLGVGFSFPLALLFLCAGAAAAALPIGPAGAATQAGASGAALVAAGIGASQALAVALSVGALGVLSGSAIFFLAVAWRSGRSVLATRANRIVIGATMSVEGSRTFWVPPVVERSAFALLKSDPPPTTGRQSVSAHVDPGRSP
jgi:hypothetical protein